MKKDLIILALLASVTASTTTFAQTADRATEPAVPMTPRTAAPQATTPQNEPPSVRSTNVNASKDWRASKLIGSKVTNMQDQSVGAINDVILDNDGKVVSVLVSVGGFLGLGEKNVAIAFRELLISRSEYGDPVVKTSLSKQALETSPAIDQD